MKQGEVSSDMTNTTTNEKLTSVNGKRTILALSKSESEAKIQVKVKAEDQHRKTLMWTNPD